MTRSLLLGATPLLFLAATGCGGGAPPAAVPATPAPTAEATPAAGPKDATPPLDKHAAAEAAEHVDPNEKEGPITLTPLWAKGAKPTFPKQTVGDGECLKQFPFSGHHKADFKTLTDRCGTPTGMLEYVKPAEGRLHAKHDKRDMFEVKVVKNMCYRYFAVADDGIKDIDILILKKGALLGADKSEHPVAVIDIEKLWCVDDDMDLEFAVEVDGPGAGGYTFGVWARPKGK